jgi:hypothetical protein
VSQGRSSPLAMKAYKPTSIEMVEHVLAITARVNQHDERIATVEANLLTVAGETSRSNTAVLTQMNTLSEAFRELRDVVLPPGTSRQKLITVPNIVVEEVVQVLDQRELDRRRQDSLRAKEDTTEKERLALEDTLATKRDAKNARVGLYIALIVMVLTEVLRLAITHSF